MKNKRAFTLIEIFVVLGIMVMVLGITIVYFFNFRSKNAIEICAKEISSALNEARSRSITKLEAHKISFDTVTESYDLLDSSNLIVFSYLAMDGIDIDRTSFTSPANIVEFNTSGALTGVRGSIYITNNVGEFCTITVEPSTGRIKIYTYEKL